LPEFNKDELRGIKSFPQLIKYLRDELDWPIEADNFEDLTFEYEAEELGIDPETAAKIQEIKQLRPLTANQPWGVFFVKFEPKKLPVVVLRRILSKLVVKKRTSANKSEQAVWNLHDLLFISNYGEDDHGQMTFANFSQDENNADLPTLKVLGWDYEDTELHLDNVHHELKAKLRWPVDEKNINKWREAWSSAFILRNQEVITTSKDLAIRLAALAQRIRERVKKVLELENANGTMRQLYRAFQETLIHDLKEDDFADMYAQTIAYGLLAARMSRPMGITSSNITDMVPNTNPFLRDILGTFITAGGRQGKIDFDELGVQEIVELLNSPETHMEAILRDFGNRTRQEDPVIHFYELFLTEYDKKKKVQRGVFYTPQPVVSYIVRSVHELLQKEFGLADGLADITTWGELTKINKNMKIPEGASPTEPFVQILDPATGTATFLVEIIDIIHKTMIAKWTKQGFMALEFPQLWNEYVPMHLLPRIYGYELMMAPYAIAHMRLGLKLFETGYRFGPDTPRANIYLTNSLEPAGEVGPHRKFELLAPALAHEAKAVNEIKWNKRFTVVVGNPPYAKASQNQGAWIDAIMEEYKHTVRKAETQIQALSDDYAKFIRLGHFLLEQSQIGILGYITNNGYLDGPLFRDMRSSLISFFENISILNLHGDSRKGFTPPDGQADQNVFDIQQGVSISLLSRVKKLIDEPRVFYYEIWGAREAKYFDLQSNSITPGNYKILEPTPPHYLFIPIIKETEREFNSGWHLYDIFGTGNHELDNHESYGAGFVTQQDKFAISFDSETLLKNVNEFLDKKVSEEVLWEKYEFCSTNQWSFQKAQQELLGVNISKLTSHCLYRPFDYRYTVFNRNICTIVRNRITHQFDEPNVALLTTRRITRAPFNNVFVTNTYTEYKVASHDRNTIIFPLWINSGNNKDEYGFFGSHRRLNFNPQFLNTIALKMGIKQFNSGEVTGEMDPLEIFQYIYAVLHSPNYRKRYVEFLKIDFPRVPLTNNINLFNELSVLGKELMNLQLMESDRLNVPVAKWQGSKPSNEIVKITYSDHTVWINKGRSEGFRGVPEDVWNFHIGGYQVCDKWLKDRKGRVLSAEDINHYQKIVVALNETIRLMKEIDEVIDKYGGWPGAFQ